MSFTLGGQFYSHIFFLYPGHRQISVARLLVVVELVEFGHIVETRVVAADLESEDGSVERIAGFGSHYFLVGQIRGEVVLQTRSDEGIVRQRCVFFISKPDVEHVFASDTESRSGLGSAFQKFGCAALAF